MKVQTRRVQQKGWELLYILNGLVGTEDRSVGGGGWSEDVKRVGTGWRLVG